VTRGKILVIRGGAIGDFILTLPALAALRQQFPQARLELLGYSHIAQLALAGGLADDIRSIEGRPLAGFFARAGTLDAGLQEYFSSFAIIISYLYDPDQIFQTNVARCSKAQFIAGPHRPNENGRLHATEVFLQPLERLAIFGANVVPRLSLNLQHSRLNQLALHAGSGSERKNWPEAKWAELLQTLLRETKMKLLLVGGEAEEGRLARLSASLPATRIQIADSLPLIELAQQLAMCSAFVGHDSGISHLAAALGLPTLVLWGDTAEAIWRPQGEHVRIIQTGTSLPQLTVARVMEQLGGLLPE
jgi:heptosyltransferase-2